MATLASDGWLWPGVDTTNAADSARIPAGMDAQCPENFDWHQSILDAGSTADQMELAHVARRLLWRRLLDVENERRTHLVKSGQHEQLKVFDEMQAQWRKLCAIECTYFRGPTDEYPGSGYKDRFPAFVADQIRMRIKFLTIER